MAILKPSRYGNAVYDNPLSVYEQFSLIALDDDDVMAAFVATPRDNIDLNQIEQDDVLSSNVQLLIQNYFDVTEGDDTLVSTSKVDIKVVFNYVEENDTLDALTNLPIKSLISYIEEDDSLSAFIRQYPYLIRYSDTSEIPHEVTDTENPMTLHEITQDLGSTSLPHEVQVAGTTMSLFSTTSGNSGSDPFEEN